jgi:hypothetical protein
MIWQLGEIWPTGGWGSLEYASPAPGGVTGGRWKPTHNWYATHLFADVFVLCGAGGACVVKNDRFTPFAGSLSIAALDLASGVETVLHDDAAFGLPAGPGAGVYLTLPGGGGLDGTKSVLRARVRDAAGELVTDAFHPLLPPANWSALPAAANVVATVADAPNADGTVDVTLTTDATAAFVTLTTTSAGRSSSRWSAL